MTYRKSEDRLGLTKHNKNGTEMKIIKVLPDDRIIVQFQDDHKFEKDVHYNNFKRGTIANPYDKTICGIGYIGVGKYKTGTAENKDKKYVVWQEMICRCYTQRKETREMYLAYEDCEVCEEWYNYQNFAKWYEENWYDIREGRMHIDKDILVKDNKIYSPDKCMFVPQRINMMFMKKNRKIDVDLPTGIHRCMNGFYACYNGKSLGSYKTLKEALYYYNIEKQIHINEVAEEYRDKIPPKLYDALINWNKQLAA